MPDLLHATSGSYTPLPPDCEDDGLLGWVSVVLNDRLRLDSIAVRLTSSGGITLSYPARHGQFPVVRPVDHESRREIERLVFDRLRRKEGVA